MDLRKKLYQMFILSPMSTKIENDKNLCKALKDGLGGVILFTKNIESITQVQLLNKNIVQYGHSPFITIDQEGGRVERTEQIFNGKKFLSPRYQAEKGIDFVKEEVKNISLLLKEMGFNMNFAPVLDVDTNPLNPIIAERAYGKTPQDVEKYALCALKTYQEQNIIPVGKHFPGHGDANIDSHLALPVLNLSLKEMEETHIRPFQTAIKNDLDIIMMAHIFCTCFDKEETPCSLSKNTITYLRNKLNFKGIIITDDMQMGGVSKYTPTEAVINGIKAGINMFLYRDSSNQTIEIIENVFDLAQKDKRLQQKIEESYRIIQKIKVKNKIIL